MWDKTEVWLHEPEVRITGFDLRFEPKAINQVEGLGQVKFNEVFKLINPIENKTSEVLGTPTLFQGKVPQFSRL